MTESKKESSLMTLLEEYAPFRKYHGLVTPEGKPSGNGLRYSGEALIIADMQKDLKFNASLRLAMQGCYSKYYPGVWRRYPAGPATTHDDYYAVAFLGMSFCEDWLTHGARNFGTYKLVDSISHHFMWRFPQLITHFILGAGRKPNFILRFLWSAVVLYAAWKNKPKDEDEWILSWFLVHMYNRSSVATLLMDYAADVWSKSLHDKVPGGIGQVLANHYKGRRLTPNAGHLMGVYE